MPIEVFDGIRLGSIADHSQLYKELASGPCPLHEVGEATRQLRVLDDTDLEVPQGLHMSMPVMDGYACIKALRKINPTVKIIGVSGLKQNGTHTVIVANANTFLQKPFTTEKLLETIHEILAAYSIPPI